eukprot:873533-Amorphochlora_amoeboformis.AAC.1
MVLRIWHSERLERFGGKEERKDKSVENELIGHYQERTEREGEAVDDEGERGGGDRVVLGVWVRFRGLGRVRLKGWVGIGCSYRLIGLFVCEERGYLLIWS